jgi:hypothetical protein
MWDDTSLYRSELRRLAIALAVSVAIHALVLCIKLGSRDSTIQQNAKAAHSRLDVRLSNQNVEQKIIPPRAQADRAPRVLTARRRETVVAEPAPSWTVAERNDMDQFLNELAEKATPPTGRALAQRALAMARTMTVPAPVDNELNEMAQKFANANVDPFSIEMYFDALFRKMNQGATMIGKEGITKGMQIAVVRVVVNQDGAVKNFRILWAADQQSEIAFIKAVIEQAAPFPVFPQDIRGATNSIVLQICIQPNSFGGGSGAAFSRMAPGQTCRER